MPSSSGGLCFGSGGLCRSFLRSCLNGLSGLRCGLCARSSALCGTLSGGTRRGIAGRKSAHWQTAKTAGESTTEGKFIQVIRTTQNLADSLLTTLLLEGFFFFCKLTLKFFIQLFTLAGFSPLCHKLRIIVTVLCNLNKVVWVVKTNSIIIMPDKNISSVWAKAYNLTFFFGITYLNTVTHVVTTAIRGLNKGAFLCGHRLRANRDDNFWLCFGRRLWLWLWLWLWLCARGWSGLWGGRCLRSWFSFGNGRCLGGWALGECNYLSLSVPITVGVFETNSVVGVFNSIDLKSIEVIVGTIKRGHNFFTRNIAEIVSGFCRKLLIREIIEVL